MTNYLGYEFSFFNSAIIILLSGIYSFFYLRKKIIDEEKKDEIIKTLLRAAFIFVIVPFLLSFTSLFRSITCPLLDGIAFYVVLTSPASIIGIALGVLSCSISRKYGVLIFFLLLTIIGLIPVFEIYFNPQIYFYNPIIGFFPGTIYDEGIEVDFKLIAYRFLNVVFFGSIIFLVLRALVSNSKYSLRMAWLFAAVVPIAFIFWSSDLGFSTTHSKAKKVLDKTISTKNFEIHYSSNLNDTLINAIALHHEFYFSQLEKFFQVGSKTKISSLIFLDREQKKRIFGAANADVAKPWLPEIYITSENYDKTLKHEMAHCFAGDFGSKIFKVADSFNPVLIEGIAMAADPIYDNYDLDYMASLAINNNFDIDIEDLFKYFNFFQQPSSLGYIVSGSFVKFLVEKYGIEKFKLLYTDLNFQKIYDKKISELKSEYEFYIKGKFQISANSIHQANYYFGRKSIFQKVCPRYTATKLSKAWELFYQKEFEKSKKIFTEVFDHTENYSSLVGLAFCAVEMEEVSAAIKLLKENISKFENTAYQYELQFTLADLYARNNEISHADSIYKLLIYNQPTRTLFTLAKLRVALVQSDKLIIKYLIGDEKDKYEILKSLNDEAYNYSLFPTLTLLAQSVSISYEDFLKNFYRTFEVIDYESCYGVFRLSQYMCENMDFENSRKLAALAIRYSNDVSFNSVLFSNFEKMNWMCRNHDEVMSTFDYQVPK